MPQGIHSPTDQNTQKPAPIAYAPCPVCSNGVVTEAQLAGFNKLLEIETKSIEQSEYIQTHGLTEFEMSRLRTEVNDLKQKLSSAEGLYEDEVERLKNEISQLTTWRR